MPCPCPRPTPVRQFLLRVCMLLCMLLAPLPGAAQDAQDPRALWLQIAAETGVERAARVAERYAAVLPGVALVELGSRWVAVASGPMPQAEAEALWRDLRASGAIPADSYLSDGARYGAVLRRVAAAPEGRTEQPPEAPAGALTDAGLVREAQRALALGAVYTGPLDGRMTAQTRDAIALWQRDAGVAPTGVPDAAQVQALLGPMRAAEAPMGFETMQDDDAGITLDVPAALVEFDSHAPPYAHFAPRDGSGVALRLISLPGGAEALGALFTALQEDPAIPGTGFRELGRESFVLMGSDDTRLAYAWAAAENGAVKGFILFWPRRAPGTDLDGDLAARDVAVSRLRASFRTDPGRVMAQPAALLPPAMPAPGDAGRARAGVAVSADGAVLTAADALAGCGRITLLPGGAAQVVATDDRLALLLPETPSGARMPALLLGAPLPAGAMVLVAGSEAPVRVRGTQGTELALEGADDPSDAGGPVLDAAGALAGLLLPDAPARALPAPALAAFLADAGVLLAEAPAGTAPLAAAALQDRAAMLRVAVTCTP